MCIFCGAQTYGPEEVHVLLDIESDDDEIDEYVSSNPINELYTRAANESMWSYIHIRIFRHRQILCLKILILSSS